MQVSNQEKYDFRGLSPLDGLALVCRTRGYPRPALSLQDIRPDGDISVLVSIASVPYGVGKSFGVLAACQLAALDTLRWWLGDKGSLDGISLSSLPPSAASVLGTFREVETWLYIYPRYVSFAAAHSDKI